MLLISWYSQIDREFQVGFDIVSGGLTAANQVHTSFLLVLSNLT